MALDQGTVADSLASINHIKGSILEPPNSPPLTKTKMALS